MEDFLSANAWLGLVTLTFLEIVLGIDNIIFISIITNRLPAHQRKEARTFGLTMALFVRIALLLCISWLVHFVEPLFTILEHAFSGRDIILGLGGLFLIAKSTREIGLDGRDSDQYSGKGKLTPRSAILQIIVLDVVFSFDSILTAVGLTTIITMMVGAVVISMFIMMFFSGVISDFIKRHHSLEVLALGFLILIGFMLLLEAFHYVIPKGYIYFAVAFSLLIELTNIRVRKRAKAREKNEELIFASIKDNSTNETILEKTNET